MYHDGRRSRSLFVVEVCSEVVSLLCLSASETTLSVSTNMYQVPGPGKIDFFLSLSITGNMLHYMHFEVVYFVIKKYTKYTL